MEGLLERARVIGELVETSAEPWVDLDELTSALASVTASHVLVAGARGGVVSRAPRDGGQFVDEVAGGMVPSAAAEHLARIEAREPALTDEVVLALLRRERPGRASAAVLPLRAAGRRLGTMVVLKPEGRLDERDLMLAEYAATIVALEMHQSPAERAQGQQERQREAVRTALAALSFSELEAIGHILAELGSDQGIVVASRVADRVGITRSVIVNALRKLESGLIIHSRSLGMKGTYIKILNPRLLEELSRVRAQPR